MKWTIYLVGITTLSFIMMGVDKQRAKNRERRIRERTLFTLAIIGGSVGIFAGMKFFRHKTKHTTFTIGMPAIIIAQIGLITFFIMANR